MKLRIRKLKCWLLGHRWQKAEMSYYMFKDDVWEYKIEPAKYCPVCGKFVVPDSEYWKYPHGDTYTDDLRWVQSK